MVILAPVVRGRKGEYYQMLYDFLNAGFSEVRIDGQLMSLRERIELSRYKQHMIELVVDRLPAGMDFTDKDKRLRLAEAIESALKYGHDVVTIITDKEVSLSAQYTCPQDGFSFPKLNPDFFHSTALSAPVRTVMAWAQKISGRKRSARSAWANGSKKKV